MTPIEELADLRVRHENLKANEARIREHYLARLAACEQQLADSVADQARLSEALEQARRNYRVAAHELETAGRAQANVEQQLAAARQQAFAAEETRSYHVSLSSHDREQALQLASGARMVAARQLTPTQRLAEARRLLKLEPTTNSAKLDTLRPQGAPAADYGQSKSMDKRLTAQGKPRPEGEPT